MTTRPRSGPSCTASTLLAGPLGAYGFTGNLATVFFGGRERLFLFWSHGYQNTNGIRNIFAYLVLHAVEVNLRKPAVIAENSIRPTGGKDPASSDCARSGDRVVVARLIAACVAPRDRS